MQMNTVQTNLERNLHAMNPPITSPILIPAVALLLLAAVAVGYQVVSVQNPVEPDPPLLPTGLTASWDVNGVMLEWTT